MLKLISLVTSAFEIDELNSPLPPFLAPNGHVEITHHLPWSALSLSALISSSPLLLAETRYLFTSAVLDSTIGKPAPGVPVVLQQLSGDGKFVVLASG